MLQAAQEQYKNEAEDATDEMGASTEDVASNSRSISNKRRFFKLKMEWYPVRFSIKSNLLWMSILPSFTTRTLQNDQEML